MDGDMGTNRRKTEPSEKLESTKQIFDMTKTKHGHEEDSEMSLSTNNVFESIARLESLDAKALKVRRTQSVQSIAQSRAARSQVDLFAKLMEFRILMQKVIGSLPVVSGETDGKCSDVMDKTKRSCDHILQQLLELRHLINPSLNLDGEDEINIKENGMESLDHRLQSEYETMKMNWKDVLNRNYRDVQISSGLAVKEGSKFKVVDQTFWDQVQSTLNHDRFLHATSQMQLNVKVTPEKRSLFGFDDSKTYQHLLQDFISTRMERQQGSSGIVDAAAERLRRSMKKKSRGDMTTDIDRRASKGRKIRYVTHEKLVNFTYPTSRPVAMIDEDILFKSLFGGHGNVNKK
jgi:protein AATF/BFR2